MTPIKAISPPSPRHADPIEALPLKGIRIVAIGASTGAPEGLRQILTQLPADLSVPILVAQHMPPNFTETFALSLANESPLAVHHAESGMPVFPGVVYIGQGHKHMSLWKPDGKTPKLRISEKPLEKIYRPSADVLFASANEVHPGRVLAIVMSGIGNDGLEGATQVHQAGGVVVTQSQETCAVYGMPKSCDQAGVSHAQLGPEQIRRLLLRFSNPL
ncbi:CheB methylesterase domain-containing protein [Mucisphaera sp.]|uniref:CheB methylesterase domain-containing protein n=1 Tax=Mucisphaera sp. TaxID=2913024 RepID=UPI003D0C0EFA